MADEIYINEIRQIKKENGITQDTTTLLSTRLNTVQPKTLVQGETAQASSGEPIEGTLNPVSKDDAYMKTDSLSVDMADDDYLPFYDTSKKKKHNIPINKLLEKLKNIFVPVSAKFSTLIHSDRTLDLKSSDIYATFNDNNVSEIVYPSANNILDARGNIITRFESVVNPDGKIGAKIYVRNYYADGTMCGQKGLQWHMDKVGNLTYKIDDYDEFRNAIHTVDQQGSAIPDNTDLDTYMTAGTYKISSNTSAQTMTNLPLALSGKFLVFDNGNNGYTQLYIPNQNPKMFMRNFWDNDWSDWLDLSQGGGASPNDYYSIKSGNYSALIQANDDLNNYTLAGTYDCTKSSITQTLLNCPTTEAFKLMVDTENNPNLVSQTITIMNKTNAMPWYRSKTTEGSWSAWKQFSAGLHTYDIGIDIPANSDLNDYKTEGVYKIAPSATMETISHRPCDKAGKLVVYNGLSSGNNYYKQIFYDVDNKEFSRICNNNNVWGKWQQAGNELLNIRYATSIPANSDLNTYRTLGTYFWTQGNSSNISNTPYNNDAGILYVIRAWENDNYYHQIVIARNANDIYERRYDVNANPQWSDWKRLSFVYEELATAGTEIPDNSDLNTYITYGKYYAQDKTHANTMSNTPTITGGFTLYVMRRTNLTQITQFMLMNNSGSCDTYIRNYDTGTTTWSTWLRIATMDDVTSSQFNSGYAVATISGSTITATIDGFQLKAGVIVTILIPSELTSACTLNISNTGAKSVKLQIGIDPTSGYPLHYGVNTFIYDGTYYRLVAFNFTPFIGVQNYTANTSGSVLIDWGYGVNRAQIKYGIGDNKLRWNSFKNSAWRGDVKIADYDDLITQKGTLIPENSDLNDYTTAGVYYIPTNANAETMSNIPVKGSGKLIVCKTDTDLRVIQLYITNGQNLQNSNYETIFYTRAIDNDGTARPWHRVTQNVNGLINLYGETTTAEDKYVGINAQIKDTTTNKAYTLDILKAYQDHQATPYGFNLVMNGGGATIVASGEAGNNFYNVMTANQKISEHLFLMADAYLYLEANANASANRQGFMLHTNGSLLPVKAEVATDNFGDIGESSHKLANIWVYKINGSTPVTSDNVIVSNTVLGLITSLDDIPLNTAGWVTLDASISPLGGQLGFQYICYGYSGRKTIDLTRVYHGSKNTEERWYNSYDSQNSSWTGWIPLSRLGTYVGTCTTASDQQVKEATVDNDFSLKKGVRIAIKFSNSNTYSSTTANPVTLNVNNTGAKNIWYNTTHSGAGNTGTATICYGTANRYIYYVYDGTYWVWDGYGVDNNNTNFLRNDASSTLTASGSAYLNVKSSTIDMTQADNAVTTTQFPAYIIQDKNGKDMSRLETVVEKNGNIKTYLQVCNYNTSSSSHFRSGLSMLTNKSQDIWYSIGNPYNFSRELGFGWGVCDTAEATTAKTVSISHYRLVINGIVIIKFTYAVPANSTLNINSQGAKNIFYRGSAITAGVIKAGDIVTLVYDNTQYDVLAVDRTSTAMGDYLPLSGGTMTGELGLKPDITGTTKYPIGSYEVTTNSTLSTVLATVTTSNGACGSLDLKATYTNGQCTIPTGWYNYFYIPHRCGGVSGDNSRYGSFFLFGMTNTNGMFRIRWSSGEIAEVEDLQKGNIYVGTCETAAGTKDKVATVDANFILRKGVRVAIKFTNTNSYNSATANPVTLNVNGTGAKNIWAWSTHSGAGNTGTQTTFYGAAGRYIYYIYDGTYWVWDGHGGDSNTTYSPQSLGFGYGTCATAESTTVKVVTLSGYTLVTNGYVSVKFTYAVPASATMNINSKGAKAIYYRGSAITAGVIKAGDLATFIYNGSQYHLVAIDGVSVNALIGNQDITTAVTSLDNIPVNTAGKIKLSASIAPLSTVAEYVYMCYGGNNFKTIQLTRANHSNYNTEELWINSNNGSGWTGWLPISRLGTYMGGCRSAGDEQAKSAVVDLDFSLKVGVRVGIKFNNTNTFSATADAPCKLNVNSTGEYAIYYNTGLPTGTATQVFGYANRYTYYIFDGSYWVWDGCGVDSNTTYSNMSLSEFKTGTATSQRTLQSTVLNQAVNTYATAYGTCTTGAGEKAKVATVTDSNWKLRVGAIVGIKFTNTNTYSNATADPITLNVNNTGAKNIWYANTHSGAGNTGTSTTAYGRANYINYYMYDGTYWVWQSSSVDNNSTYSPQSLGIGYGTCTTAEATTAKVATLSGYSLVTNGIVAIKFTYAVPASSTLNINSKGAKSIYHRGSAISGEIIKAGDIATFIYNGQYHLLGVDRTAGYKDTISAGRCITSGSVPQKFVNFTDYVLVSKSQLYVLMTTSNTAKQALTLEVNNTGAKPIYINGSASSSSNYTLPAGTYLVYYNGTNFYFRTDGKITCAGTVTV